MGIQRISDADAQGLLAATLRDPFMGGSSSHAQKWFEYLISQYPLLTFQTQAYLRLHESPLPITYPLARFVQSIPTDEGFRLGTIHLGPLDATLDRRRRALSQGTVQPDKWDSDGAGTGLLADGAPCFLPEEVAYVPYRGPMANEAFQSPYASLGYQVLAYAEDWRFAANADQRAEIEAQWQPFLTDIGAKVMKKPSEGVPEAVARALRAEAVALIEQCWHALQFDVSEATEEILARHGVPRSETSLWAAQLAVPVLSRAEIQALQSESGKERSWSRGDGKHPTAKRFVVWVLAHRLADEPARIARRAFGTHAMEYFEEKVNSKVRDNPITAFLPGTAK